MEHHSINSFNNEDYEKAVRDSMQYVGDLFAVYIGNDPSKYLSIVRDNPDRLEEQLNTIQTYINFMHRVYLSDIESYILSTMVGTQLAFFLGYKAGQKDTLDDAPLPDAFRRLSLDNEE